MSREQPVRVTVTGAAGQIGYSLVFRIASGQLLGPDQPVDLRLLEIPQAMGALEGVAMELVDCAFPLLASLDLHDNPSDAFDGVNIALLVGSRPRTKGMERAELLSENGKIFTVQGKALNDKRRRRRESARRRQPRQHQLPDRDEQRARHPARALHGDAAPRPQPRDRAARRQGRGARHRHHADGRVGQPLADDVPGPVPRARRAASSRPGVVDDQEWIENDFLPNVGKRGAAIIEARGASSAASAASAAIDHVHDWVAGTDGGWVSMGSRLRRLLRRPRGPHQRLPVHVRERRVRRSCRASRSTRSRARRSTPRSPSSSASATRSRGRG